eukprot:TRINITY_DN2511_c0_g1_i4.p1 TRINITY_DN2511_c0_g1~~TRINITY_DN2511_c0_g1_i4.p1  ORF type:complete len:273 (+),score=45.43 TRINITY_DN2511_c0_g1_i4:174-992(+)
MTESQVSSWDTGASYFEIFERLTIQFGYDAIRLADLKAGSTLIDIACGTGGVAIHASNLGIQVTAVDNSQSMLDIVNMREPNMKTILANGQTLDEIESDRFDCACSIFGIYLFPDRMAGWKSALRVLKQDGVFVASAWDVSSYQDMLSKLNRIPEFLPEEKKPDPYKNGADFRDTMPLWHLSDKNLFKKELEQSGFRDVEIFTLTHSIVMKNRYEMFSGFNKVIDKVGEAFDSLSEEERNMRKNNFFNACGFYDPDKAVVLPAISHIAVAKK